MNIHVDLFGDERPAKPPRWRCLPVPGSYPAAKVPIPVIPPAKNGFRRVAVVDSFAGAGGATNGIEEALQRLEAGRLLPAGHPLHVTYAVNHDEAAIATHFVNHRRTIHLPHNVWQVSMRETLGDDLFGFLWLSPDCFPAGTLVLTDRGYRPIELIEIGDVVLTHKLRWRKVVQTHRAMRPLMKIRGRGHHGMLVSPEHPFLVKKRTDVWQNAIRQYRPTYTSADWQPASVLGEGSYWGTPTVVPPLPIPEMIRSDYRASVLPVDERLMWLAGRYLGDGWTRISDTRAELVIICGKHEADALHPMLDRWPRSTSRVRNGELAWSRRETRTSVQFAAQSRGLVTWLRDNFGHGAEHKTMPAWVYGMPIEYRRALLDGYLSADGWNGKDWKGNDVAHASTISRALAYSLKQLASTLGHAVGVHEKHPTKDTIEGRKVNAKSGYDVRWRPSPSPKHARTFVEDDIRWTAIAATESAGGPVPVFNIGVEEEESYVVEGIIVHNCRDHSTAKGGPITSRAVRDLAWVLVKWLKELPDWQRPWTICLENVGAFAKWSPLIERADGQGFERDPDRIGWTFHQFVHEVCSYGYSAGWDEMVACEYGSPTIRKRLKLCFRRDAQPIVIPAPTHGDPKSEGVKAGRLQPWPVAADIIDFGIACPSIFLTKEEAREYTKRTGKRIIRPLALKTDARLATGVKRHVIDAGDDAFVVTCNHAGDGFRGQPLDEPFNTVASARDAHGLVVPKLAPCIVGVGGRMGQSPPRSIGKPWQSTTTKPDSAIAVTNMLPWPGTASEGEPAEVDGDLWDRLPPAWRAAALKDTDAKTIAPFIGQQNGDLKPDGSEFHRAGRPATQPLGSLTTSPQQSIVEAAVAPFVSRGQHGGGNRSAGDPLHTIAASDGDQNQVAAVYLAQHNTGEEGHDVRRPVSTIVQKGCTQGVVAAYVAQHNGGPRAPIGRPAGEPLATLTVEGSQQQAVVAHMLSLHGNDRRDGKCSDPHVAICAGGNHSAVVTLPLVSAYYGVGGFCARGDTPLPTVSTRDRFGLTHVDAAPQPLTDAQWARARQVAEFLRRHGCWDGGEIVTLSIRGVWYVIVDIGMRMLTPRELARAQSFPESYILDPIFKGKPLSETEQRHKIGNSVCKEPAAAFVEANYRPPLEWGVETAPFLEAAE